MLRSTRFALTASTLLGVSVFTHAPPARACGGCFHAETDTSTSFVTDHRMAIAISTRQTVLWDQVKYTGSPSEFAWVLPVTRGTKVELARDEWLEALDLSTKPSVKGPDISCTSASSSSSSSSSGRASPSTSSGGGGCAPLGAASSAAGATPDSLSTDASAPKADAGYASTNSVEVIGQEVVGPYSSVVVHSSEGAAMYDWLRDNGFAVPANVEPILAKYTKEGFDFLALRLRPGAGVAAMQPVRVVMPGAIARLPLRMVAAGMGTTVGLTLFVVTEGRMRPANFPNAVIDPAALRWDPVARSSNYRRLVDDAIGAGGGRTWITEYAGELFRTPGYGAVGGSNIGMALTTLYHSACVGLPPERVACDPSVLPVVLPQDAPDAGASASDASLEGGADADANADAGDASDMQPPPCTIVKDACELFDDDSAALDGLHSADVRVTRLRAELDTDACSSQDLVLEPDPMQGELPAQLFTNRFSDPSFDPCASLRGRSSGTNGTSGTSGTSGESESGCACNTSGDALPVSPVAGALGVLFVLRSASRRRRR